MKFLTYYRPHFGILLVSLYISSCIEIENDFGKQKMPGDLLVTNEKPIEKIFWHDSNIYYFAADIHGNSLMSVDVSTKEIKVLLTSLPAHLTDWIKDNFFYVVSLEQGRELIRYDLTGSKGSKKLAANVESIIYQNNILAFNRSGEYDENAGGSPVYLLNENTGQEQKIGYGVPMTFSPDAQTLLLKTDGNKNQSSVYHFFNLTTNSLVKVEFNILANQYYKFFWRTDGLYVIQNQGNYGSIINLETNSQLGSWTGLLWTISPSYSKLIFTSTQCLSQPCKLTWEVTDFTSTGVDVMTGHNLNINQIIFSPDEKSIAYLARNEIYTLKIE